MSPIHAFTNNEPEVAPHVTSTRAEGTSRRYLAIASAVCCILYLFPFFALRSGIKPDWWITFWASVIGTNYTQGRQDADIVVFGDSTAVTDLDPTRMTHDLNRKVIVLPNAATSLAVTGYDPLEQYLSTNKPPQLIIFYFSAWNLDFMHTPFTPVVVEGLEMLLLHEPWAKIVRYSLHHPDKVLSFPLRFYAADNRIGDFLYARPHEVPMMEQGHLLYLSHSTPMKKDCTFNQTLLRRGFGDTSAREAVSRFTTPETKTMVLISPVPNCKNLSLIQNAPHPGLSVVPPQVLAPENFREDTWQAHMLTGKIGPSTDHLEEVIRQKLQSIPSASPWH